jgi:hypothetical protein
MAQAEEREVSCLVKYFSKNISERLWYSSGHFSSCLSSAIIQWTTEELSYTHDLSNSLQYPTRYFNAEKGEKNAR